MALSVGFILLVACLARQWIKECGKIGICVRAKGGPVFCSLAALVSTDIRLREPTSFKTIQPSVAYEPKILFDAEPAGFTGFSHFRLLRRRKWAINFLVGFCPDIKKIGQE